MLACKSCTMSQEDSFKRCSTCRQPILFEQKYWTCSVSTCNRSKLALYFCSLPCWEAHVPEARHRDAWAEEQKAPSRAAYLAEQEANNASVAAVAARIVGAVNSTASSSGEPPRAARIIGAASSAASESPRVARIVGGPSSAAPSPESDDDEILVVVSKLKKYIRDRSGMNTSDTAMAPLSEHLRSLCREAIRHAAEDGRKTVMDRDFAPWLTPRK